MLMYQCVLATTPDTLTRKVRSVQPAEATLIRAGRVSVMYPLARDRHRLDGDDGRQEPRGPGTVPRWDRHRRGTSDGRRHKSGHQSNDDGRHPHPHSEPPRVGDLGARVGVENAVRHRVNG